MLLNILASLGKYATERQVLTISDAMSVGPGLEKKEMMRRVLEPEPIELFALSNIQEGRVSKSVAL
jgi:hypothetical protein